METPEIPPGLRFLAGAADDPAEQQSIVRAYYTFARGTPDSASVQFALLATALAKRQAQSADATRLLLAACKPLAASLDANSKISFKLLRAQEAVKPAQVEEAVRAALAKGLDHMANTIMEGAAHTKASEQKLTQAFNEWAKSIVVLDKNLTFHANGLTERIETSERRIIKAVAWASTILVLVVFGLLYKAGLLRRADQSSVPARPRSAQSARVLALSAKPRPPGELATVVIKRPMRFDPRGNEAAVQADGPSLGT